MESAEDLLVAKLLVMQSALEPFAKAYEERIEGIKNAQLGEDTHIPPRFTVGDLKKAYLAYKGE